MVSDHFQRRSIGREGLTLEMMERILDFLEVLSGQVIVEVEVSDHTVGIPDKATCQLCGKTGRKLSVKLLIFDSPLRTGSVVIEIRRVLEIRHDVVCRNS